jgi:hypothetical protein
MTSYTLGYALKAWANADIASKQGIHFDKNLSIALRYYVIPEISLEKLILKPKELHEYAQTLNLEQSKDAMEIFERCSDEAISLGKLSTKTRANYRSALGIFINWMQKQVWWLESSFELPTKVAPFRQKATRKTVRKRLPNYGLKRNELSEELKEELEEFKTFRKTGGNNLRSLRRKIQQSTERAISFDLKGVSINTLIKEEEIILSFLGWHKQHYPDNQVSIKLLVNVQLIDEFAVWLINCRDNSYALAQAAIATSIAIAKWIHYPQSKHSDWSDISLILDLQDLQNEYSEAYAKHKKENMAEKWSTKEITHEELRQVVQYLHSLCSPYYGRHDPKTGEFLKHGTRPNSAIVSAWQAYFIVKYFVYCPVRQEEIRNLKLGENLFRQIDQNGNPYYSVLITEHKRSRWGKPRNYPLPNILTADLDLWINKWRPLLLESVQTVENWIHYWRDTLGNIEGTKKRLELAKQGIVSDKVKISIEKYIARSEQELKSASNGLNALEKAKSNVEGHNYLFFMLGKSRGESFGKPHTRDSVEDIVSRSIAGATNALFGEAKWINPHALRHIAEKHIRLLNKSDSLESFGTLIGHSKETGDEYAAQITTDYELSQKIVDDWWL